MSAKNLAMFNRCIVATLEQREWWTANALRPLQFKMAISRSWPGSCSACL
jgi:hypothetical protein